MKVLAGIPEMKEAGRILKSGGKTIGLVPTMGSLHEGHLSLVRESRRRCGATVVSIFVNPIQFGPKEDLDRYPRDLERDRAKLDSVNADLLFHPRAGDMYPGGYKTFVEVHDLEDRLCGAARPGHFRGVSTVVLKLFNIVEPDMAFFGRKDAQQAVILEKMVSDLNLAVKIVVMPIVREPDGLAMSSRNSYLSPAERKAALVLSRSLEEARTLWARGEKRAGELIKRMRKVIASEPLARSDYIEIVHPGTLEPLDEIQGKALIAMAVFIGNTRLIDNTLIGSERED